jgi:hypothetical protein
VVGLDFEICLKEEDGVLILGSGVDAIFCGEGGAAAAIL